MDQRSQRHPTAASLSRVAVALALSLLPYVVHGATTSTDSAGATAAPAETTTKSKSKTPNTNSETQDTKESTSLLDKSRKVVARTINRVARAVDHFFANSDVYTNTEGSWASLGLGVRLRSDGKQEFVSNVEARLALPNTEKKYNLLVESNTTTPDPISAIDPLSAVTKPVYTGGLRYIVTDSKTWHVHFDVGVEFNTPLDAFVRTRVSRTYPWERTQLRLAETLTKYQSGRANTLSEVVLDNLLPHKWLWRNSLALKVASPRSESYSLYSSSLFHRIDKRHAIQLQALAYGLDDPARIHEYQLNLRYRIRSKTRDWVFYEIAPQRLYNENNGFQPVTSIYLRVDLLFRG
jgi:hypothetical protein